MLCRPVSYLLFPKENALFQHVRSHSSSFAILPTWLGQRSFGPRLLRPFVVRSLIMLDEPRNDLSPAALTLEATTASPATMTEEPQGRPAAPTSRQPQEENPVSNNSRVCTGTSRQLSSAPAPTSAPAHPRLLFSGLTASSSSSSLHQQERHVQPAHRPTAPGRGALALGQLDRPRYTRSAGAWST